MLLEECMRISELIANLEKIKKDNGDIEVTCTASLLRDGHGGVIPDIFESTVENLILREDGKLGRRVRIYF